MLYPTNYYVMLACDVSWASLERFRSPETLHQIISRCSGVNYDNLSSLIKKHPNNYCKLLSTRTLRDVSHPLHPMLSSCRSIGTTRSSYPYIISRTAAYRNFVVPQLCRFFFDKSLTCEEFPRNMSFSYLFRHVVCSLLWAQT